MPVSVTLLKSGLIEEKQNDPDGMKPMMVRALKAMLLTSALVSMGWMGRIKLSGESAILDFVGKGVDDDVAGDLVHDQRVM